MKTVHNKLILDVNSIENKSVIIAKQADSMSRYIDITLQCAGEEIVVNNNDRAVLMAADKSTGETVAMLDCTVENGVIIAELSESLLAVPGNLKCEIVVYGTDGSVLTTASFVVVVSERIDGEVVEREEDFSALQSALSDVASTSNRIDEVQEIADTRIQPISLGGTGASSAEEAINNLGAFPKSGGTVNGNVNFEGANGITHENSENTFKATFIGSRYRKKITDSTSGISRAYDFKIKNSVSDEETISIEKSLVVFDTDSEGNITDTAAFHNNRSIQIGNITITPESANSISTVDITFSKKFTSTPYVFLGFRAFGPDTCAVSSANATATGFTLCVSFKTSSTITINYLAIESI